MDRESFEELRVECLRRIDVMREENNNSLQEVRDMSEVSRFGISRQSEIINNNQQSINELEQLMQWFSRTGE